MFPTESICSPENLVLSHYICTCWDWKIKPLYQKMSGKRKNDENKKIKSGWMKTRLKWHKSHRIEMVRINIISYSCIEMLAMFFITIQISSNIFIIICFYPIRSFSGRMIIQCQYLSGPLLVWIQLPLSLVWDPALRNYLPIAKGRVGFTLFVRVFELSEAKTTL